MKNQELTIMGFSSFSDFAATLLGTSHIKINFFVGFIAATTSLITGFIYDSEIAVYTLWALYLADFASGVAAAWYKNTLRSSRLPRIIVNIVAMTMLLSISWWMAKSSQLFFFLPGLVIGGAYTTLFISLIENLSILEILPAGLERLIKKKFGLGALEKKMLGEDETH